MIRKISGVIVLLLLLLPLPLFADTAFSCPDPGSVKLNATTRDEIETAHPYGSRTRSIWRNGESVEMITYTQTSVRKSLAVVKKVTPARAVTFFFLDDVLVGYEFVSSFKEDHTDFDDTKVSDIKQGVTLEVMGEGSSMGPLNESMRAEAIARGLIRYFTSKPCKHGHVAGRMGSGGICMECQRAWYKANSEKAREKRSEWAKANPDKVREKRQRWRQEAQASPRMGPRQSREARRMPQEMARRSHRGR